MSKISDIYEAIVSKIETALPTYNRIPNPYDIADNPDILLDAAYGIAVGAGINTQRFVGCATTWEREFTIGMINQKVNLENDTIGKASIEKNLLEDHKTLLLAIEKDPSLGGICIKCYLVSDGGIQYLDGDRGKFLALEVSLVVEYLES